MGTAPVARPHQRARDVTSRRRRALLWPRRVTVSFVLATALAAWPASAGAAPRSELAPGGVLERGQSILSPSGTFRAVLEADGNLVVVRKGGRTQWATGSEGLGARRLTLLPDGNLVIERRRGSVVWSSHTKPTARDRLVVTDGGQLAIESGGRTIWTNGTYHFAPMVHRDFPDPSVLKVGRRYYAYSTQSLVGGVLKNSQVATSRDGRHWSVLARDPLPTLGPWAQKGATWAPTVARSPTGGFVMYYAALDVSTGVECIGRAASRSPLGPFVDHRAAPVLCQSQLGGSIDPDLVASAEGPYLVWKSNGAPGGPSQLWSVPLDADLLPAGPPTLLLDDDQAWQQGVVEGPDMVGAGGAYLLLYGANDWSSARYAIGYAVCATPSGPCSDQPGPLLATGPTMAGPGGPSVFAGPGGHLLMAFASWPRGVGYPEGVRALYVAAVHLGSAGLWLSPA